MNDTPNTIARVLDFPGFYESILSRGLDWAEEQAAENIAETHPELDTADIASAMYDASEYGKGFDIIARACVDYLNTLAQDTGIELAFESMESPREYNFTTDALYVTVNDPALLMLRTRPSNLDAVIAERFTSGPGFHSFYSNDPDAWRAKPLDEWDHNELGALLTAFLRQRAEEEGVTSDDMLEYLNEDFDDAVDKQTDWDKLYAALGIEQ